MLSAIVYTLSMSLGAAAGFSGVAIPQVIFLGHKG